MSIQVRDIVKGLNGNGYGVTNENMTRGVVTDVFCGEMRVKVLRHSDVEKIGKEYDVENSEERFEVIGHLKEFDREVVIEIIKNKKWNEILEYDLGGANLGGANLRGANLRGANLSEANLDYSCLPLWCGGLHIKADKRIACQIAYHLCSLDCEDTEFIKMRNSIIDFANRFHRAEECGVLEPIDTEANQL